MFPFEHHIARFGSVLVRKTKTSNKNQKSRNGNQAKGLKSSEHIKDIFLFCSYVYHVHPPTTSRADMRMHSLVGSIQCSTGKGLSGWTKVGSLTNSGQCHFTFRLCYGNSKEFRCYCLLSHLF